MRYYCYDQDGYYTHSEPAQPRRGGGYLDPPPRATFTAPPEIPPWHRARWDGSAWSLEEDPLDEHRAEKLAEIEADRDAQAFASVTVHGRPWQADQRSQDLLSRAIQIHGLTGFLPPVWRDEDNNDMTITDIQQLIDIAAAIAQQVQTAYTTSWARKAALDAAQTHDEVDAV